MNKIFCLTNRVTEAIIKYEEVLNDPDLFDVKDNGNVAFEMKQVYGELKDEREGETMAALEPEDEE